VFTMQNGSVNIATINRDGSGLTQLTFNRPGKAFSFDACFSPDGTKILFAHYRSTGWIDLYTMSPRGSRVTQVTKTASAEILPGWAAAR
jgi:Tol biopolymer transport system component